jgi:hypothetical protein
MERRLREWSGLKGGPETSAALMLVGVSGQPVCLMYTADV